MSGKRISTIIKEINLDLDRLAHSDGKIRGVNVKYVMHGNLSNISYIRDKRGHYTITFTFENNKGNSKTERFFRLTDSLFEKKKPKWLNGNNHYDNDIDVNNDFVVESTTRFIESLTGKKLYDIYILS